MGILVAFLVAALLSINVGCSPCERLYRRCPPIEYVRDSVWIQDTLIRMVLTTDTLVSVRLVKETERVTEQITDTATAHTTYAYAIAFVEKHKIHLALTNKDSAEVLVQRVKELEQRIKETYRQTDKQEVRNVYRTRGIVTFFAWSGGVLWAFMILLIVYKLLKHFI